MLRFYADKFVELTSFVTEIKITAKFYTDEPLTQCEEDDIILIRFRQLREVCEVLGLKLTVKYIDKICNRFSLRETSSDEIKKLLDTLTERIDDELADRLCMVIPQKKADFYEQSNLFGDKVFNSFPSATFDIEEAGKCFAVARFTACVMHLQRVLEVGLKSYGTFLGIASLAKSAQPSWNRVLDETRKEVKERNDNNIPAKVWTSNEAKEFCQSVQPFLEAVQIAWRNPSMHADKIYGEEIAEEIFSAVKRFMKNLAEHLDESGNFTPR